MLFTGFQSRDVLADHIHAPDRCTMCREPLNQMPVLFYKFDRIELWLHPECGLHFIKTLEHDCLRAIPEG